jgi:hypothetical protein
MSDPEFTADYFALRAANDRLRERGLVWIWETLEMLCAETNRSLGAPVEQPAVHLARQPWQFEVGRSVMVGERFGVRYRGLTLLIEVGWPRVPEHGFVPDQGLARGRVSLSLSPILDARPTDELILKARRDGEADWRVIRNRDLGENVTADKLRSYLDTILQG